MPKRVTDLTPEDFGNPVRFEVNPGPAPDSWEVYAFWEDNHTDSYDGHGIGVTIEEAMAKAIADLSEDNEDD